jgi:spore germination protein PC
MWNSTSWNDWQRRLYEFHWTIQRQEDTIRRLEDRLALLEKEMLLLKDKKTIHVDKIEYKFDQLKVETLSGQLHIGLSPGQTEAIEDFAVNQLTQDQAGLSPLEIGHIKAIQEEANALLDQEGWQNIKECCLRYDFPLEIEQYTAILDDLKKQLPKRIDCYVQSYPKQAYTAEKLDEIKMEILKKVKQDVFTAMEQYVLKCQREGEI